MALFICAKCGGVDNTALSSYHILVNASEGIEYHRSLVPYIGKPLCSECATAVYVANAGKIAVIPGKWHGKFPKRQASDEEKARARSNGIFTY